MEFPLCLGQRTSWLKYSVEQMQTNTLQQLTLVTDKSLPIFIGEISPRTVIRKVFDAFLRKDTHINL